MSKDDEPLLDIEEPYYVLESPDVLVVPHNTPIDRTPIDRSPYSIDHLVL
jgi:hypothetical protein